MIHPSLLSDDLLIADAVFRVRYLIAEHFRDRNSARARLEHLAAAGIFASEDVVAVPVEAVEVCETPAAHDVDAACASLAAALRRRWSKRIPRPLRLYYATLATIHRLGGDMRGRIVQEDAITHDLGTSATFGALVTVDSRLRSAWVPEERIPETYKQVHPDALLADANGPRAIIEFCGMYSAERLLRLATFAQQMQLPLQLWTCADCGGE